MNWYEFFTSPFVLGLALGLVFAAFALMRLWHTKREFTRYKKHLSDKLEIEADVMKQNRLEKEELRKQNENLRSQLNAANQTPDRRLQRDLEIMARAEKKMSVSAPGFVQAWEKAKSEAEHELQEEDAGRSLPKRVFNRIFSGPAPQKNDEKEDGPKSLTYERGD